MRRDKYCITARLPAAPARCRLRLLMRTACVRLITDSWTKTRHFPVTSDGKNAAAPKSTEAGVMSKQIMSYEEAAQALVSYALDATLEEFPAIAEQMLEDNSPGEIAAIGAYLPEVLRELLPKRTLH